MNRLSIMLAVAALSASDYPIGGASEPTDPNKRLAPANRAQSKTGGWFGLPIKATPSQGRPLPTYDGKTRTEGVIKGPGKLTRAQRKAKRK